MYEIEKGVPLPGGYRPSGGIRWKYPFESLEVGDSFVADASRRNLGGSIQYWGKKLGRKFAVRKIDETHTRIWRVK